MGDQQVAGDVIQYKLSISDGWIHKGSPIEESLYHPKRYKEMCIWSGMQVVFQIFNNSRVSSLVSLQLAENQ